jgi:hypothetical protein
MTDILSKLFIISHIKMWWYFWKKIYSYNFQFTFVTVIKKHEYCVYDSHEISRRNTSCEHVRGKYSKSSFKYEYVHGK